MPKAPALQFAIEMAFSGLNSHHPFLHFDTQFTHHQQMIPINGLIWMGDVDTMMTQLEQKNQTWIFMYQNQSWCN